MLKNEILETVKVHLSQSIAGQKKEDVKFDFKRQWYDLGNDKGINEFLKDTSSIANTFGWDGFIVIGFDDDKKDFHPARFSDCGLKDDTHVQGILVRRLSHPFDLNIFDEVIDGHELSIIHIPPALDKPFIIKEFKRFNSDGTVKSTETHKIFVRRGTSTEIATKYDIDLMYYDRKNIVPDYSVEIDITFIQDLPSQYCTKMFYCHFSIENLGRRTLCIHKIILCAESDKGNKGREIDFTQFMEDVNFGNKFTSISEKIVLPNSVQFFKIGKCVSEHGNLIDWELKGWNRPWMNWLVELHLTNGKVITTKVKIQEALQNHDNNW